MDKKRDSFTFQRYYFEAISTLKSKEKLELYDAICAYVFEEKDAILNSKKAESCFILIKHMLDEEWKRRDIASKGWSTRKSSHPHVINEMKVSSSMSSKSDDDEPIVSTDNQTSVKTLPESAVKKKPDIFSDFAHGDKALLETLREFAQMRTRIKKPMTDRAKQMLCKPDVVDEIIPDLELDLFRPELRDAFAAVQGYWTARGKIDIVEINTQHPDVAQTLLACVQTCESECVRIDREQMQRWAQLIREQAALTRVQGLAFQMTSELTDYSDLSDIYQQMGEAMSLKAEEEDAWTYEDVLNDYVLHMDEKPVYIKTGLERLDEALHISPGDFIIIGGRPSAGKTALSLQIAASMAKQNYTVYYFSLETSKRKLSARLMANQIYCPLDTVKNKAVSLNEIDGQAKNMKMPLYIRSAAGKNVAWMKAQALRKKAQVIFVDYLQLIHETGAKDRYAAITAISIALHELAQTTGIVVVALAQLNRNPSKPGATPTNSDLRESGQIEQDADAIILLSGDNPDKYLFRLSKNKEGEIGDLPITFNKQIQRFQEYTWMD